MRALCVVSAVYLCFGIVLAAPAGAVKPTPASPASTVAPSVMHPHKEAPANALEFAVGSGEASVPTFADLSLMAKVPSWKVKDIKAFDSLRRLSLQSSDSKYNVQASISSSAADFAKLDVGDEVRIEQKGDLFLFKKGATVLMGATASVQNSSDLRGLRPSKKR